MCSMVILEDFDWSYCTSLSRSVKNVLPRLKTFNF